MERNSPSDAPEWARLLRSVDQMFPGIGGQCFNFTVTVEGRPAFVDGEVLIRAELQEAPRRFRVSSSTAQSWTTRRCLVRLRRVEWDILRHCGTTWKIIQAPVKSAWRDFILDCTGVFTVVVARATLTQDTTLQMAELFSGGFAGWAQAAYILRRSGIPLQCSWSVDRDPACSKMTAAANPESKVAANWHELDGLRFAQDRHHWHLQADVEDNWWLAAAQTRPVQVMTVSAPCQPWSRGGSGAGLATADGAAILRAADICGFLEVPVVAMEQVEGFIEHAEGQVVLDGWRQAGYRVVWQDILDIAAVLPASRRRHLIVFAHDSLACETLRPAPWVPFSLPDLGRAGVLLDLPQDVLRQCLLDDALWQKYMDPWYLPPMKGTGRQPTPYEYRVKGQTSKVGCMVAQYGSQHLLPESVLSTKGLHGPLVQHKGVVRFFAPAEVYMLQGGVLPIAFSSDTRTDYRLLGNAISVPHAVVSLVYACKALQVPGTPSPQEAVACALHSRLRKSNSVFVPAGPNWVLCHRQQLSDVFASVVHWAEPGSPPDFSGSFVPWVVTAGAESCQLQVASTADPVQVCGLLGLTDAVSKLLPQSVTDVAGQTIEVDGLPAVTAHGHVAGQVAPAGLGLVLTAVGPFVVDYHGPLVWLQMLRVSAILGVGREVDLAVFSPQGRRLSEVADFTPCCIAVAEEPEFRNPPLSLWPASRDINVVVDEDDQVCVAVLPAEAPELWLAYPFHLLQPLGWKTRVSGFPPQEGTATAFCNTLVPGSLQLPPVELQALHRLWYMVARLDAVAVDANQEGAVLVEVQVVASKLWQGHLLDVFEVESLEDWWVQGSKLCDFPPRCRVFSGPFPLPEGLCVHGLDKSIRQCVVRNSGARLLTIHPEVRGGGSKDADSH